MQTAFENIESVRNADGVLMCNKRYVDGKLWAIVFANDNGNIRGKVAYNCDDLQCDYDWDWEMPMSDNGEVDDTDIIVTSEQDVDWLMKQFDRIVLKEVA